MITRVANYIKAYGFPFFLRSVAMILIGKRITNLPMLRVRRGHARRLAESVLNAKAGQSVRILEVGSAEGESSAIWAEVLGNNGTVTCVDIWLDNKSQFARFKKRMRSFSNATYIHCDSAIALQSLKQDGATFDIIFIDGDHRYSAFSTDLRNAQSLLTADGIICGDDYELPLSMTDVAHTRKHKETDTITDPATGKQIHPGVICGIADVMTAQSTFMCMDGFWWITRIQANKPTVHSNGRSQTKEAR